jgi:hypothetical protein
MTKAATTRLDQTRIALVIVLACVLAAAALIAPDPALGKKPQPDPDANPVIVSLSEYWAPPGTVITITGTGFGDKGGRDAFVTFAGEKAKIDSWSDTLIEATVPKKAEAGYVGVTVDGVESNGMYFFPGDPTAITDVDPLDADPGTQVTITGTNFEKKQGSGDVTFAGVSATVVSWSETSIVVEVPDGAPAGYVGVWQNGICSNGIFYSPGGLPAIDSISADYGIVGDTVSITGSGFGPAPEGPDSLTLAGVPVTPTEWSETSISFEIPEGAEVGYVGVWRGHVCSNGAFLFVGPRLDTVSSWWGAPGSDITLSGIAFGDSAGSITFGDVEAAVVSWSDTAITVTVPQDAQEGCIGVWKGGWCSNGAWFLPMDQPSISSVDTTTVSPGAVITIDGADFGTQTPYSQVTIDQVDCEILTWTDTQITARVTAGVTNSGYLGVWQKGVASNGIWMTVTP